MNIREAQPADLFAVAAIEKRLPTAAGWTLGQFQSALGSGRYAMAVLEEDGKIAGYCVVLKVPPEAQLVDICIAPEAAGRGCGRKLLEHLIGFFRSAGYARVTLELRTGNEPALKLYGRAGFQVVGRRKKFYNDGADAILMDLDLS